MGRIGCFTSTCEPPGRASSRPACCVGSARRLYRGPHRYAFRHGEFFLLSGIVADYSACRSYGGLQYRSPRSETTAELVGRETSPGDATDPFSSKARSAWLVVRELGSCGSRNCRESRTDISSGGSSMLCSICKVYQRTLYRLSMVTLATRYAAIDQVYESPADKFSMSRMDRSQ